MDTVTPGFSVEEQAADMLRLGPGLNVDRYAAGSIAAITREGGLFDNISAETRIAYIRNALAAAELVRAEQEAQA